MEFLNQKRKIIPVFQSWQQLTGETCVYMLVCPSLGTENNYENFYSFHQVN
jgi:hypothetical protein